MVFANSHMAWVRMRSGEEDGGGGGGGGFGYRRRMRGRETRVSES